MDALLGLQLTGKIVQSDGRWMVVFPDAAAMRELLRDIVRAEFKDEFGTDYKLVEPLSWSSFEALRENNGLHITLEETPKDTTQAVFVTVTGHAVFKERAYVSNLGGVWTKGFVVLLVSVDSPKTLKCNEPCHVSVGQSVKKTQHDLQHETRLSDLGLNQ